MAPAIMLGPDPDTTIRRATIGDRGVMHTIGVRTGATDTGRATTGGITEPSVS
jgi:hypothetical protein